MFQVIEKTPNDVSIDLKNDLHDAFEKLIDKAGQLRSFTIESIYNMHKNFIMY